MASKHGKAGPTEMSEAARSVAGMNSVRFVHTADWQLGMRRHVLGERHSSFDDARLASIRAVVAAAENEAAEFILVTGDVFDENSVAPVYVIRALDALGKTSVPVYLLPGNHDLFGPGSVYSSETFVRHASENVHVITDSSPVEVREGVHIVGLPVVSKNPAPADLEQLVSEFPLPVGEGIRILALHGGTDFVFSGTEPGGADFAVAELDALVSEGKVDYVGLGDRHSVTPLGSTGRVWYPGAPEVTAFDDKETDSGKALLVELEPGSGTVEPFVTGSWSMLRIDAPVDSAEDIEALRARLEELPDKDRTVVKLTLVGTLTLELAAELDEMVAYFADLFVAAYVRRDSHVARRPDLEDIPRLFSGYASSAATDLTEISLAGGDNAGTAENALALLYRLSRKAGSK